MYLPFDVWNVILPHTNLKTLLICRGLCKKILKIANNVIKTTSHINWIKISTKKNTLSVDFIREFKDKVDWKTICINQTLSEDFIREFKDKVDWYGNWYKISMHQTLSEDFIREFQDKVYWNYISCYQTLSEDFIREFKDKLPIYVGVTANLGLDNIDNICIGHHK